MVVLGLCNFKKAWCLHVFFIVLAALHFWLQCRTGLLMVAGAWSVTGFLNIRRRLLSLLLCAALVFFLLLFKTGSTNGRFFILQNTLRVIAQHPGGTGLRGFEAAYNNTQANYFSHHDLNTGPARWADYTQFSHNDYLQFAAEWGLVPGVLFLLLNILVTLLAIRRWYKQPAALLRIWLPAFFSLQIMALFYYPLHSYAGCGWYIICLLALLFALVGFRAQWVHVVLACGVTCLLLFTGKGMQRQQQTETLLAEAVLLSQNGYTRQADSLFTGLSKNGSSYMAVERLYARHRFNKGYSSLALEKALALKPLCGHFDLYLLLGEIYQRLMQYTKAEYYYRGAVYMVPNRLSSRFQLAAFYKATRQWKKARQWFSSVVAMPAKVKTELSQRITAQAVYELKLLPLAAGD
jgi:tetratricopeptide (TPR) repeat protein